MATCKDMRPLARLCLRRDDADDVCVEVHLDRALGVVPSGELSAAISRDGRWASLPEGFAALYLTAAAPAGPGGGRVEHWLDLSHNSQERAIARQLVEQDHVRFVWSDPDQDTGAQLKLAVTEDVRGQWLAALEASRGVDPAAWGHRVAEARWARSASWRPERPVPDRARVPPPSRPAGPYALFAPSHRDLPEDGSPTVGGLQLPLGSRCPQSAPAAYWATYDPPADLGGLTSPLARAFPATGLWPVLWEWDEDPEHYLGGHADLTGLEGLNAGRALSTAWTSAFGTGSRESLQLAERSTQADTPQAWSDPFAEVNRDDPSWQAQRRLLLVACHRPADALAALDWGYSMIPMAIFTAVLRSWEERFAAVLVQLEPSAITLAVGAPPTNVAQATDLAAELTAIAGDTDDPQDLAGLADMLITGRYPQTGSAPLLHNGSSHTLWRLTFNENGSAALEALVC
jgi:Domain of unknown function (DUF4253)